MEFGIENNANNSNLFFGNLSTKCLYIYTQFPNLDETKQAWYTRSTRETIVTYYKKYILHVCIDISKTYESQSIMWFGVSLHQFR